MFNSKRLEAIEKTLKDIDNRLSTIGDIALRIHANTSGSKSGKDENEDIDRACSRLVEKKQSIRNELHKLGFDWSLSVRVANALVFKRPASETCLYCGKDIS